MESLISNMQWVIHFYDINCQYSKNLQRWINSNPLISIPQEIHIQPGIGIWHVHGHHSELRALTRKLWTAKLQLKDAENAFKDLNMTLPDELREAWKEQEHRALWDRIHDLKVIDIFDVIKSVEMDLIEAQGQDDDLWGSATWIAQGLNIEEAQIALKMDTQRIHLWPTENQQLTISCRRDKLQSCINDFLDFMGTLSDDSQDFDDTFTEIHPSDPEARGLLLPSYLGLDMCQDLGLKANDSLHAICLALADKSHLFHTDVRHSHNYNMTSHT
ncbi:hypothetical protein V8B97DRAFT_2025526 [Scleroderma yunnanense]